MPTDLSLHTTKVRVVSHLFLEQIFPVVQRFIQNLEKVMSISCLEYSAITKHEDEHRRFRSTTKGDKPISRLLFAIYFHYFISFALHSFPPLLPRVTASFVAASLAVLTPCVRFLAAQVCSHNSLTRR